MSGFKDENVIFRTNSMATAMFQTFSKVVGIRYLWKTLGSFLLELELLSPEKKSSQDTSEVDVSAPSIGPNSINMREKTSLMEEYTEMEVGVNYGSRGVGILYSLHLLLFPVLHTD